MDIETLVQRIVWGGVFAMVHNTDGQLRRIILRSPTLKDKQFIEFIYNSAIKEAKDEGCIGLIELSIQYQKKGLWGKIDDDNIEDLEGRIKQLKYDISSEKSGRKKDIFGRKLDGYSTALIELRNKRFNLFQITAEKQAESIRTGGIIYCSTYTEQDEKLWASYDDFQNEQDNILVQSVIGAISEMCGIESIEIRKAARSNYWRMQWNAGKSIGNLFGKPIIELDTEQNALVYWSQVYDYVYEHSDKPDESVIQDDKALDEWFDNEDRKKKVENVTGGKVTDGVKLSSNIARHGEIFIVANPNINPTAPTTQSVENLNDSLTRKFKAAEAVKLKSKKQLTETQLRDRRNKVARRIIGSTDAVIKKGSLAGRGRGGKAAGKQYPGGTIG